MELGRHDADELVPVAVDFQLSSDDVGCAAKASLPQRVADDDDFCNARVIVVGIEHSTQLRAHAEQRKIRRAHEQDLDTLRFIDLGEVRIYRVDARDRFEELRSVAIVVQLRRGHADVVGPGCDEVSRHSHETVGLRKRQGPEDDAIDDGKHRRVRADAQGESRHGHSGEPRMFTERSPREPHVLKQEFHEPKRFKKRTKAMLNAEC